MSRRNKLQKFAEVAEFRNVYENFNVGNGMLTWRGEQVSMQGKWAEQCFENTNPTTLELACGKGEYSVGLALQFPDRNFIGVDIKGARIWKGARRALQLGLTNVAFLRTRIELMGPLFAEHEVSEIWIVFPDPFPRDSKANRRLTSPPFLNIYRTMLIPGGIVHLKTDDDHLYKYTLEVVASYPHCELLYHNDDIYAHELQFPELDLKTFYETQHLEKGKTIKYIRFRMISAKS